MGQKKQKKQVLRTKQWDSEDRLFLLETHHTTRRLRLLLFSSFFYLIHYYHTILPVSLSGLFSSIHHLHQSVTHTDILCNTPGSKLNSTLLDLRPFRSSKWLCSVTTLQHEWETCRGGRETGWQTQTWQGRRGSLALIIHTYCRISKKQNRNGSARKVKARPEARDRKRERSWPKWWGIPRAVVHSEIQSCASLGP